MVVCSIAVSYCVYNKVNNMTLQQRSVFSGCEGNRSLKRKGVFPKKRVRINYEHRNFRADCKSRTDLIAEYNRRLQA